MPVVGPSLPIKMQLVQVSVDVAYDEPLRTCLRPACQNGDPQLSPSQIGLHRTVGLIHHRLHYINHPHSAPPRLVGHSL